LITTVAGVCDILFGMRRCRIDLPNRCYHLISRVAHRALEFGGLQAANRKGRYDKENLLGYPCRRPRRIAIATASERDEALRRVKAALRCALTQSRPMPTMLAISALLNPFAT